MMPLMPLKIPAGVYKNGTNYESAGRWWDANLVRWYEGAIRPVGGWTAASPYSTFTGVCRGLYAWHDNLQNRWCAIGTNDGLWVYNGGSIYNIAPSGFTPGRVDSFPGAGYGYGPYGSGPYGAKPVITDILVANTWQFDNWGEWLVGCAVSDGKLYQWDRSIASPAVIVSANAPTKCLGLVVSSEQYLIALGANGDVRRIMWCNQGDFTDWTPTDLNTAGDLLLQTQGKLMAGRRMAGQVILWTDVDIHAMSYLGPPLVYGIQRRGGNCGLVGPNAVSVVEAGACWMSYNGFFIYNGSLNDLPCDVADAVFSHFNRIQAVKVYAGHNSLFGEIWWFYPSAKSTENDSYCLWNYRENHWNVGKLARTAWADMGVFPAPLATDATPTLWQQETGWTANGTPIMNQRYAKSGPIQIGAGDQVVSVRQVLADERTSGQVTLKFTAKMTPESVSGTFGPYLIKPYTDARLTGRQISQEIWGAADADWRVGTLRLDAVAGSRR